MRLLRVDWKSVAGAATALSHAEITLAAERAAKDAILEGGRVTTGALAGALRERQSDPQR